MIAPGRTRTLEVVTLLSLAATPLAAQSADVAGCWSGTMLSGRSQFRAAFQLERTGTGWTGTFHALAGDVESDSIVDVVASGDSLRFAVPALRDARLAGRLAEGGRVFVGEVVQDSLARPFRFERLAGTHPARRLIGYWSGALQSGGAPLLRIGLGFAAAPCRDVLVTMDSPDQGAENLRVTALALDGDSLRFEMSYLGGSFVGKVTGDTIQGDWTQGPGRLQLVLARGDSAPEVRRPQEPEPPFPYDAEEVAFENTADGVTLAGTLTLPRGVGPFPAAVLLSGSGPQDRNEALMGHKPFLVLADHLTRRGIAVLRYDDRGVGGSTGNTMRSTLEDNADDALAAVTLLRRHPKIDAARVGLIGHSEGGWVGPIAATRSGDVAFVVMLAGPGVAGEELLYQQNAAMLRVAGRADLVEAQRAYLAAMFAAIKHHADTAAARRVAAEQMRRVRDSLPAHLAAQIDSVERSMPAELRDQQFGMMLTPWFRYLLSYDPRRVLTELRTPVLAAIGEKDVQVPPDDNLAVLRRIFAASGHPDYTVVELEGLNHLFQTAETGAVTEYGMIEETMAPRALELVADWILERFGGRT